MSAELKVTVYWGDILYDTAICHPDSSFTVGPKPGNSFILQIGGKFNHERLELVKVSKDSGSAEVMFDDEVQGHVRLGGELLPLQSLRKDKGIVADANGFYRFSLSSKDSAELVIGYCSFFLEWTRKEVILEKSAKSSRSSTWIYIVGLTVGLGSLVYFIGNLTDQAKPIPPERVVQILSKPPIIRSAPNPVTVPVPTAPAKAAAGQRKTADGGAAKGELGKAKLVAKKTSAADSLKSSDLGNLVRNLSSLGGGAAPSVAKGKDNEGTAGINQTGTGGFSTDGLKTGGGGKSVGIGRTVGQGEGGFGGTGRLGLSGTSLVEGGTGVGGGTSVTRGGLDRDVIDNIVRRRQDRIRLCYERQLNFFPKLSGKVSVRFTIGKAGNVIDSQLVEDTMKNDNVRSCILAEVKTWTFPAPSGGTLVTVDYPFVFESSARTAQ